MILNHRAQRAVLAVSFTVLGVVYLAAWLAPTLAVDHESGVNLVLAKALAARHGYVLDNLPEPVAETGVPPVFPALLALFAFVSTAAQWLKIVPLGCAVGWLWLTRRLLLRMGASDGSSWLLVGLTAISPMVIFLSTNLLPETLFAMLATATLLRLLDDKPLVAGALAGLATLTLAAGAPLIAACILTLAMRSRFRSALIFAGVAMAMVAPWSGWSLAHLTHATYLNADDRVPTNILMGLAANEKLIVASRNLVAFFSGPIELMTGGFRSPYGAAALALVTIWCLWVRRQLVPDLFVALYGFTLMFFIWPPERLVAAVLPMILWIAWRAFRLVRSKEAIAAVVLIVIGIALWADGTRLPALVRSGVFPEQEAAANEWSAMRPLLAAVKTKTSAGSVVLTNADGMVWAVTGRKTVRGFTADGYNLFYTERQATVTPDEISSAILREQVNYVVVTPDEGEAESASFHRAVEALEHGGVLRPVEVDGLKPGYELWHVEAAGW
ncbi:MAG TPA: hypothetical protein VEF06_10580 [Bryobacteraceae bacterium]|nr:hypothetical protein [Bryobacteraceae bacterium]